MSGPIFGLCSEHLSILSRIIGLIRSQTRRNASTSTIAEANLDDTRSIFVCSRERSTTYQVDVAFFPCGVAFFPCGAVCMESLNSWRLQVRICYFAPVTRHSFQAMCTMFSRKDFSKLFNGLLRISPRKTNAELRCMTSP